MMDQKLKSSYTDGSIVDFATRIGKIVRVLRVHVDFVDDESEKDPNGNVEKFAVALSVSFQVCCYR